MQRLLGVLLLCVTSATAAAWDAPLFSIPTHVTGVETAGDGPLNVALYARDLGRLAEVLGAEAPAPGTGPLLYTIGSYPQLPTRDSRSWLEPTFLIDYDEPDLVAMRTELVAEHGESPSLPQLVDFVSGLFEATYARGWEVASVAARNRKGDCTHHSVVTAALARSFGIPARVVLGAALLRVDGQYGTYGHAWVEWRSGEDWVVADAALREAEGLVRYLPFGVVEDEGPGFLLAVMRLTPIWLQGVEVIGERPATETKIVN